MQRLKIFVIKSINLLPFALLKAPFNFKLYFNIMYPIWGLSYYFVAKRIARPLLLLLAMALCSLSVTLYYQDYYNLFRIGQLIGLFSFPFFLAEVLNEELCILWAKRLLFCCIIFAVVEFSFSGLSMSKIMYGHQLYGLRGILGEPNFTGTLILGLTLILSTQKFKWPFIVSPILLLLLLNRSSILVYILFLLLTVISWLMKGPTRDVFFKSISSLLMVLNFLTPFIWIIVNTLISPISKRLLEVLSNGRYHLFVSYSYMGMDFPFGVGFYRGPKHVEEYYHRYLSDLSHASSDINLQQHNLFIQVWSEFGPIGYLLFWLFLGHLFWRIYGHKPHIAFVFSLFLLSFQFLNGFGEFILYFMFAFVMLSAKKKRQILNP